MREIEFRGKQDDNGDWVYGDLVHGNWIYPEDLLIRPFGLAAAYNVYQRSVGQYTGLEDKKGDIVKSTSCMDETDVGEFIFRGGEWLLDLAGDDWYPLYRMQDYENGPTLVSCN
jgi:hypothetical protein